MPVTDDSSMNIMLQLELRRGRLRPDRLAFYFSVEITTTTVSYTHAVTACVPLKSHGPHIVCIQLLMLFNPFTATDQCMVGIIPALCRWL